MSMKVLYATFAFIMSKRVSCVTAGMLPYAVCTMYIVENTPTISL